MSMFQCMFQCLGFIVCFNVYVSMSGFQYLGFNVCFNVWVSLYVSMSGFQCLGFNVWVSMSMFQCLDFNVWVSMYVSMSRFQCLGFIVCFNVYVSMSVSISRSHYLCFNVCVTLNRSSERLGHFLIGIYTIWCTFTALPHWLHQPEVAACWDAAILTFLISDFPSSHKIKATTRRAVLVHRRTDDTRGNKDVRCG